MHHKGSSCGSEAGANVEEYRGRVLQAGGI